MDKTEFYTYISDDESHPENALLRIFDETVHSPECAADTVEKNFPILWAVAKENLMGKVYEELLDTYGGEKRSLIYMRENFENTTEWRSIVSANVIKQLQRINF